MPNESVQYAVVPRLNGKTDPEVLASCTELKLKIKDLCTVSCIQGLNMQHALAGIGLHLEKIKKTNAECNDLLVELRREATGHGLLPVNAPITVLFWDTPLDPAYHVDVARAEVVKFCEANNIHLVADVSEAVKSRILSLHGKLGGAGMKIKSLKKQLEDALTLVEELRSIPADQSEKESYEELLNGQDRKIADLGFQASSLEETLDTTRAHVASLELENQQLRRAAGQPKSEVLGNPQMGLMGKDFDILELPLRAHNIAESMGIKTIRDLVMKNESDFLRQRNFGWRSLWAIRLALKEVGLKLGMADIIIASENQSPAPVPDPAPNPATEVEIPDPYENCEPETCDPDSCSCSTTCTRCAICAAWSSTGECHFNAPPVGLETIGVAASQGYNGRWPITLSTGWCLQFMPRK